LKIRLWLLCVTIALCCEGAFSQAAIPDPGPGTLAIPGTWHFHTGDDLAWASKTYDDADWQAITLGESWAALGHAGYSGYAWYRKHLDLRSSPSALAVLVPEAGGAYEIYWNGEKLGSSGRMPPNARWFSSGNAAVYPFPRNATREGVLSLRFWTPLPSTSINEDQFGLRGSPQLGALSTVQEKLAGARYRRQNSELPDIVTAFLMLTAGLLSLAFFLQQTRHAIYFGLTLLLLGNAVYFFLQDASLSLYYIPRQALMQLTSAGINVGLWIVLLCVFGLDQIRGWRLAMYAISGVYMAAQVLDACTQLWWQFAGAALVRTDVICTAIYGALETFPVLLVCFGLTGRRTRSTTILGACAILYGSYIPILDLSSLFSLGLAQQIIGWHLQIGSFSFTLLTLLNWLLVVTLVFTVFRYWTLESRRQVLLEQEIRSAQEVQHILLPEPLISVPGLDIASVYKPAAEVGGDFFQVISLAADGTDTSTLIVVGDVSGKGLKAAMTVALIIGTLRTLAESTRCPAEILAGLNRRLLGRTQGGFATCLVMRVNADGYATLANAGHLAPYRSGVEWELPAALPLGVIDDARYEELDTCIQEGEQILLITDGVLEAQSSEGALFGFERLSELMHSQPTAEQVAEAACSFGQADDITVVSVTWSRGQVRE
jgi:hypothetical protein